MKVLEKFIEGKHPEQDKCEDGLFYSENHIAVIDGVSDKSGLRYDGHTGGKVLKGIFIQTLASIRKESTIEDLITLVNQKMETIYKDHGVENDIKNNPNKRAGLSFIVYSIQRKEFWISGDCHMIVDGEYFNFNKKVDEITTGMRSLILQQHLLKGKTVEELIENDLGRKYIQEALDNQQLLANKDCKFGYELYDASSNEFKGQIIKKNAKEIILASDGYPKLFNNLKDNESYIQKIKSEDPLCINLHQGTKAIPKGYNSFDDRAFIKVKLD